MLVTHPLTAGVFYIQPTGQPDENAFIRLNGYQFRFRAGQGSAATYVQQYIGARASLTTSAKVATKLAEAFNGNVMAGFHAEVIGDNQDIVKLTARNPFQMHVHVFLNTSGVAAFKWGTTIDNLSNTNNQGFHKFANLSNCGLCGWLQSVQSVEQINASVIGIFERSHELMANYFAAVPETKG